MPARSRRRPASGSSSATLRIIGGDWRGRRVAIAEAPGLRPTSDRVRETLFNWLAPRIQGARCIDLFAGTGALGLEALSRGAAEVLFIDRDRGASAAIGKALATLGASERARVHTGDALAAPIAQLTTTATTDARHTEDAAPDIVFIDPPFAARLHARALAALSGAIAAHARLYLEYPIKDQASVDAALRDGFVVLRRKRAGRVGYCLARPCLDGEDSPP